MHGGAEDVDPVPPCPGSAGPGLALQMLDDVTGAAVRRRTCRGSGERAAQQVEGVADTQQVVAGLAVEGERARGAVASVLGRVRPTRPVSRVLPGAQPVDLLDPRAAGAVGVSEEQVGDLDGVALGAHGGRAAGSVGEQSAVGAGLQAAGDDVFGLGAGGVRERGDRAGQVRRTAPWARRRGALPRQRRTRAGLPPTTALAGTSLVTTLPAPITAPVADGDAVEDHDMGADPDVVADRMPWEEIGWRNTSVSGSSCRG